MGDIIVMAYLHWVDSLAFGLVPSIYGVAVLYVMHSDRVSMSF